MDSMVSLSFLVPFEFRRSLKLMAVGLGTSMTAVVLGKVAPYLDGFGEVSCGETKTRTSAKFVRATAVYVGAEMIAELSPSDFEVFIGLVLAKSGWQCTTISNDDGQVLMARPATGETAFIRVSSSLLDFDRDECLAGLEKSGADHLLVIDRVSFRTSISICDPRIRIWDARALADLAFRLDLFDWLLRKIT